ncbi:MAG: molybdopterin molybdotransferase MoeA [Oscillospiraceae bacterium]|nr:molybdopterin molybdotransferase MoeA [Oscillospiraceae bacterium]
MPEAAELLLGLAKAPESETLELMDACGRVLAESVYARLASPPFDKSPFDGYAFRGEDTASASPENPVTLTITEEIPAGSAPTKPVAAGTCAKILTGAPMPEGANATIGYERVQFTAETVTFLSPFAAGSNVVRAGEDITAGSLLAERGEVLTPAHIGVLACQGFTRVNVYKKPVIGIISTGSELVRPGEELKKGQIYNSSLFAIGSFLRSWGAELGCLDMVGDDPDVIASALDAALQKCDCVLTTGGASVGDYDFDVAAAEKLGAEVVLRSVRMKPGGAMIASVKDGKLILGLSGNPASALLALLMVGMPHIKALCGRRDLQWAETTAALSEPFGKKSPQFRYLRGRVFPENGRVMFRPNEGQGNGSLMSFCDCNAIALIPAGSPPQPAGTELKIFVLK